MNILIVGFGNIGQHLYAELTKTKADIKIDIYDPKLGYQSNPVVLVYQHDIAFICVPTDSLGDGSCDISIVEKSVSQINADVIVIKSTVPVGTTEALSKKYQKHLVMSPEYYGTTQHSEESPNFLVLGGDQADCDKIAQLYYQIKDGSFRIMFTSPSTAELAKYMENCFLATKVTFCNEFALIAKEFGVDYNQLREIFISDPRMGESHTFVLEHQPYYDSHCLNKDIPALIHQSDNAQLMQNVYQINQIRKQQYIEKQFETLQKQ